MANREGRKTIAAELPVELYERLKWCVGRTAPGDSVTLKRMSDVIRWMLDESFHNNFHIEFTAERKKAAAAANRAAKKAESADANA